jgi:hypothetical protein
MEDTMIGFEVIFTLIVTRILLPLGLLLFIGERLQRREQNYWKRA